MQKTELKQKQTGSARRSLVTRTIYAIPLVMGGSFMTVIGNYLFGKQRTQNASWVDAGDVSDVPGGTPRHIRFERVALDGWKPRSEQSSAWIVLDDQRRVTAFSPLCTHLGCAYRWQAEQKRFVCPCHGSIFGIRGEVIRGPASRPLDRYTAKIEGDRLWLGPITGVRDA